MPQPLQSDYGTFFQKYITQAASYLSAVEALQESFTIVKDALEAIPDTKTLYAYAPGKWTLKEVVQHLTDTERIMAYRALCIARGETANLPGFDENTYAAASGANYRKWEHLLEEWVCHRQSAIQLFKGLNETQIQQSGTANNHPVTANALGFLIAGHSLHHLQIIGERYLNETYAQNVGTYV